ncbi:MAG: pilus assembly protein TadG-related protein [Candidatus Acidiferrales bacterium]
MAMLAVSMFALIALMGLAIDMGYYRYFRRKMQTAADAAALAGALQVPFGSANIQTAGTSAATENGFTAGNGVTVTISNPPVDPPFNSSTYPTYVEAKVTESQLPTFFSRIFGVTSFPGTLTTSAVAEGSLNCIYALDTSKATTVVTVSNAIVNSNCGITDNSGMTLTGGFTGLCAPSVQVFVSPAVAAGSCSNGKDVKPAPPTLLWHQVGDPFAYLTAPCSVNDAGCGTATYNDPPTTVCPVGTTVITTVSNPEPYNAAWATTPPCFTPAVTFAANSNPTFAAGATFLNTLTINGGFLGTVAFKGSNTVQTSIRGGLHIQGGLLSSVNFYPGVFVISGGISDNGFINLMNFNANCNYQRGVANGCASNPTTIILDGGGMGLTGTIPTGAGVFIYNTADFTPGFSVPYGAINVKFGLGTLMQAPTGGNCGLSPGVSCAGILFFQDRNNPQPAVFAANLTFGSGNSFLEGAYYFKDATVNFQFDFGANAQYSFLVAKDLDWTFAFTFRNSYQSLPNNSPIQEGTAVLVQ